MARALISVVRMELPTFHQVRAVSSFALDRGHELEVVMELPHALVGDGGAAALAPPPPPPAPVVVSTLPSLNAPLFFEIVEDEVYRSNKCDSSSFPFLATLQLNTVVYLSYDDLSRELADFFKERDVTVVRRCCCHCHCRRCSVTRMEISLPSGR